ncbi:hypothetical protein [Streptomyces lydicus]|uniref:hypothetical protein n=1 Tax=Streptomyces lydicus TaxID=47763 RepID=UPI00378B781F
MEVGEEHGAGGGAPALCGGEGVGDAQQVAGDVADTGEPAVLELLLRPVRGAALGDPGVGADHRSGLQLRHDVVGLLVSNADGGQAWKTVNRTSVASCWWWLMRASSWPYASGSCCSLR